MVIAEGVDNVIITAIHSYRHIKSSPASCLSGVRTTVASRNEFNSLTASLYSAEPAS